MQAPATLNLSANTGELTARSMQSLNIPTNKSGKSGNESAHRMKLLALTIGKGEEPLSHLSLNQQSCNRSDLSMSVYDDEEGNSTRKFTGGLKPDNFADQKFERKSVNLNIPRRDLS